MWNHRCILMLSSRYFHTSFSCSKSQAKPKVENFGLNEVERKHLNLRLEKVFSKLKSNHVYKESLKIDSKYDLAKVLVNSEIYHKDGLIGLIKPFGICRFKEKIDKKDKPRTITASVNYSGFVSNASIEEVLPLLSEHYDVKNLEVIFYPERWISGIMLLSTKQILKNKVQKCIKRSQALRKPFQTYWAVVHGLTVPEAAAERVGVHFKYIQNLGSEVPFITKTFSKTQVYENKVKPNIVEHVVLGHHKENDVSLVEVNVMHMDSHFIRNWLAHCCSPVLGDRLFGSRVKKIMGKRVAINPNNIPSYQPQEFSSRVLEKLHLLPDQAEIIPPHIHLSKLTLNHFENNEDIIITACPPEYFNWTCKQLCLMSDDENKTSNDSVINSSNSGSSSSSNSTVVSDVV